MTETASNEQSEANKHRPEQKREYSKMYTSPKRMISTKDGRVVEAGPGVSGILIVAEGGQISEERARKYGLMPPEDQMPKRKPMVAPIIVHGPEGEVTLEEKKVKVEPPVKTEQGTTSDHTTHAGEGEVTKDTGKTESGVTVKPWSDPNPQKSEDDNALKLS